MVSKKKIEAYQNFANAIYTRFRSEKYGITACCGSQDIDKLSRKKEICDWQDLRILNNAEDLTFQTTWDPVYYSIPKEYLGKKSSGIVAPIGVNVTYNYGSNGEVNMIQINNDGNITNIYVTSSVTVNRNNEFTHEQTVPSCSWVITHNFGFIPNVYTTNLEGQEIEGVVVPVDGNTIQINFSEDVTGYAYLS